MAHYLNKNKKDKRVKIKKWKEISFYNEYIISIGGMNVNFNFDNFESLINNEIETFSVS